MSSALFGYWPYHLVNYVLAAVLYTLFGRVLLGFFVGPRSDFVVMRFFRLLTDPVVRVLAPVTPGFLPPTLVPLYVAFWVIVLRVAFWSVMWNLELAPRLGNVGPGHGGG